MEATPVPDPEGRIPDRRPPLDLPRLVMRRAAAVAVLGVLAWLLLGLAWMRDDVDDELAGARSLALLFERLGSVAAQADDGQARRLLGAWAAEGRTRHLQVQVHDADGRLLMRHEPEGRLPPWLQGALQASEGLFRPAPPFTVSWPLPRPAGPAWTVSVTSAPQSERAEALRVLASGGGLLALLAAGMLAVMAWNTRHALAPLARLLAAIGEMRDGAGGHPAVQGLPTMPIAELETIAAALRRLDASLAAAQTQRQRLAWQVQALQEDERQHLARELHDEFGQQLTALRANAAWLQRRSADLPELAQVAREMAAQCEAIQQDVRSVLGRLRPLPEAGPQGQHLALLGQMLQSLVVAWPHGAAAGTRLRLQLELQDAAGAEQDWDGGAARWPLPPPLLLALYRISQEALTNVARHAGARHATLQLLARAEADGLRLDWSVHDDGRGLGDAAEALARGSGLAGIKQRLWALGAELQLADTAPGCRLSARVHWRAQEAPHA